MNILNFNVEGTNLILASKTSEQTSGSVNSDRCCFSFDESWNGYSSRIAYFGADRDKMKPVYLLNELGSDSYCCLIPREVLAQAGSGEMFISVGGTNSAGDVLRTKLCSVIVSESGRAELFITEEESEAFLNSVSAAVSELEGKAVKTAGINPSGELIITFENGDYINLGVVKGAKGDRGEQGAKGDKGDKGDDSRQLSSVTAITEPGYFGKLSFVFSDGSSYQSDVKALANLQGNSLDIQQLAEYLYEKDVARLYIGSGGDSNGDIVIEFKDGSSLGTGINLKPRLPTGTGGANERYTLQELATFLYEKILEKAQKGDKGDTGPQGPKGDKGDTGAQGPKGEKGDTGNNGVGIVQAYINPTGQLVLVYSNGHSFASENSIVGDKGDKGDKGDTGATGPQGEKGDKGDTGEQGVQGEKGDKGDKGDDSKQITMLAPNPDPGSNHGKLTFVFNDGSTLATDVKALAKLGSSSYDMQQLADYLYSQFQTLFGKQIQSVTVIDGGRNDGKLQFTFADNSTYLSEINLKPALPTGSGGNNQSYTLQQLASFLYSIIGEKADKTEIEEKADKTIISQSGIDYEVSFKMINGAPCLECSEITEQAESLEADGTEEIEEGENENA